MFIPSWGISFRRTFMLRIFLCECVQCEQIFLMSFTVVVCRFICTCVCVCLQGWAIPRKVEGQHFCLPNLRKSMCQASGWKHSVKCAAEGRRPQIRVFAFIEQSSCIFIFRPEFRFSWKHCPRRMRRQSTTINLGVFDNYILWPGVVIYPRFSRHLCINHHKFLRVTEKHVRCDAAEVTRDTPYLIKWQTEAKHVGFLSWPRVFRVFLFIFFVNITFCW